MIGPQHGGRPSATLQWWLSQAAPCLVAFCAQIAHGCSARKASDGQRVTELAAAIGASLVEEVRAAERALRLITSKQHDFRLRVQ